MATRAERIVAALGGSHNISGLESDAIVTSIEELIQVDRDGHRGVR